MRYTKDWVDELLCEETGNVGSAFDDWDEDALCWLKEGLLPFARKGSWVEALCRRLEEKLSGTEREDWSDLFPGDILTEESYGHRALR